MNAFAEKRSQALETCEKVMEGIENGTTSVSAYWKTRYSD